MQGKISMDLSFCQSEIVFSLDGLVTRLAGGYKRKAFAELLKIILQMVQGRRSLGCMIISAAGELI